MARMHHARRIARTSLLAGGMVAFALAAPAASSAQGTLPTELPSGNGLIAVSDASGKTTTIDSIGFNPKVLTGAPEGTVGWWSADNRLSFLSGTDVVSFVDADVDFTTAMPVAGLTPDAITGAAGSPHAVDMAIASDSGVVIVGEFGTKNASVNPAGRVAWTAEGTRGALVFDGRAAYDPEAPGDLPGAPGSADQGTGIWRYDVETEQLVNLVSDPTAKNSSVSQDGNVIAYEHTTVNGDTDIHYVDRREPGMPPHALLGQSAMNEALPAVSPDGTKVAHYAEAGGPLVNVKGVAGDEYGDSVMFLDQEVTSIAWQPAAAADPGAPSISGEATVGTKLTLSGTDASGTGPMTTELTWQRCAVAPPDSGDCTNVGTGAEYTLVEADLGHRIQVVRKVSNVLGEDSATSPLTAVVQTAGSPDPNPNPNPNPVDSTAPDPPSFTGFPQLSDPDTTPTFSWVGSEPGGRFECQIVGGLKGAVIPPDAPPTTEWEACTSPFTTPELAEGPHLFRVRHFDDANNVQGYDEYDWTVAAAPPAPDTDGPLQPTFTSTPDKLDNDPTPTFAWTGAEPGGTFQCRISSGLDDTDYGTWTDCASPFTTPELTDGFWTIGIRQVDDANNPGDARYFEYELDTHAPDEVVLLETPMLTTPFVDATFKFRSPAAGNRMECRLDPAPEESPDPNGWQECTSPVELKNLPAGKHRFEVREVDEAGNAGVPGVWNWIVKPPVVEQPKPEKPVEEKPVEKPVVETPAPAVQAPAVETPAPAAPAAPAAKPVVTPVKPPALTAVIGGTKSGAKVGANGGTSSAATIEVAKEAVGVGCSITGTVLKSCKVDLYAPKASGARARAAAAEQVLVGTGTYESKSGSEKMDVRIELNATGKAMLRANPGGLKVTVKISGQPVSGAPLKATGAARLVTDRASATVGGFAVKSAVLAPAAKAQLRRLAKFGKGATVRCVGHTDGSTDDARYLRELGQRRAKAVCKFLAAHGVKVSKTTLVSKGSAQPLATNGTKAGRAQNRRVQVTLVR